MQQNKEGLGGNQQGNLAEGMGNNKQGRKTKEYFPKEAERLQRKINLTQNFTILVTGHGNLKFYLHRFKIIEAPECRCGNGNQTTEHVLLDCGKLQEDRERLIAAVAKTDNWPIN
jgi:hypothetical protein